MTMVPRAAGVERYDDLPVGDSRCIISNPAGVVIVKRDHASLPVEDRLTILWRSEGPDDLSRRGHANGPVCLYAP
jgi:hypothetical protein